MALCLDRSLANAGEEEIVRICVLGASGVGKSSLCNFLCDANIFRVNDGFDSCTKQSASYNFAYNINNKNIKFEITDTPGWFDADNERLPSVHSMLIKINECIKISETGITAYFIVIPFERISIDTEQSIYFMRDCFDSTQLKHVWMIFTKCKKFKNIHDILQQLLAQKNRGRNGSGLIYNYSQLINEQCFATDTHCDDEKELDEIRDNILKQINDIYNNYGMIPDGVFQTVHKNYKNQINILYKKHNDKIKKQQLIHYRYKKQWMTMGTIIGVGFVAVGINGYIKYNALWNQHNTLTQQTQELSQQTSILSQQTEELQTVNAELENINRQKSLFAGITEVTAGALWFAIEPISGAIAIMDGLSRLWGYKTSDPPK